jgi:hypothetical protein
MDLKIIQKKLNVPETGQLDDLTKSAIRNFQLKNNMIANGIPDQSIWNMIAPELSGELDSDLTENIIKPIKKRPLFRGQFLNPSKKRYIFLHHTAGWDNPYNVVDAWNSDNRGTIGTQFIIGGINSRTGNDIYDGEIVECMQDSNYAWHLGIGNTAVHRESVGIEICNLGYLTKGKYFNSIQKKWISGKPDAFYSYIGTEVPSEQVCDLGYDWRGYRFYHKYTDKQLSSLVFLIEDIAKRHKIDIKKGIYERLKRFKQQSSAFDYDILIRNGNESQTGVYSHTNVVAQGKWDLNPQPELIKKIQSL